MTEAEGVRRCSATRLSSDGIEPEVHYLARLDGQ